MIHDAIVKFDSIGICTVLLCISIGTDRKKIARKSIVVMH